jgi:hypothetical protein
MATATQPTLGGVTLAYPDSQTYTRFFRGGTLEMADGSIVHDLVDTTVRHRFRLKWTLLNSTEKGTIQTQWDAIKNATATYVSIENASYTVTQPEGAEMSVTPRVTASGEIAFDVELELIEDS